MNQCNDSRHSLLHNIRLWANLCTATSRSAFLPVYIRLLCPQQWQEMFESQKKQLQVIYMSMTEPRRPVPVYWPALLYRSSARQWSVCCHCFTHNYSSWGKANHAAEVMCMSRCKEDTQRWKPLILSSAWRMTASSEIKLPQWNRVKRDSLFWDPNTLSGRENTLYVTLKLSNLLNSTWVSLFDSSLLRAQKTKLSKYAGTLRPVAHIRFRAAYTHLLKRLGANDSLNIWYF